MHEGYSGNDAAGMEPMMQHAVAGLLFISALLLGSLIPGGPIEKRDFSHLPAITLGTFNVFLTILGLGSFAAAYFCVTGHGVAFIAAALFGLSYCVVYALDLAKIFPVSPDRMPTPLFWIEVVGLVLAMPLIGLSLTRILLSRAGDNGAVGLSGTLATVVAVMIVLGAGIVLFATKAAMRGAANKPHG